MPVSGSCVRTPALALALALDGLSLPGGLHGWIVNVVGRWPKVGMSLPIVGMVHFSRTRQRTAIAHLDGSARNHPPGK